MIRPSYCGVGPVTSPVSGEVSSVCVWSCSATISGNEYGGKNNFSWSQASLPGLSDVRLVFQGCGQQCSLTRGARARCGPSVSRGFGLSKKAARPAEAWGGPAPWDRCYHPSLPRAGAVVAIETSRPPPPARLVCWLRFCCSWRGRGWMGSGPRVRAPGGTRGGPPLGLRRFGRINSTAFRVCIFLLFKTLFFHKAWHSL